MLPFLFMFQNREIILSDPVYLHVNCSLLFYEFNQYWDICWNFQISSFRIMRYAILELMHEYKSNARAN
jgi:hypothetical protein